MNARVFRNALIGLLLLQVVTDYSVRAQGNAPVDKPIGVRILTDPELFPKQPDGPDLATRLTALGFLPSSQRTGIATTGVMDGYAPVIEAVIKKYGKPDRIVEEARESGRPVDLVHYWGDYGLAVAKGGSSGKVVWVCRRLSK